MARLTVIEAYRLALGTFRTDWRRLLPVFWLLAALKLGASLAKANAVPWGAESPSTGSALRGLAMMGLDLCRDSLFVAIAIATAWWVVTRRRATIAPVLKLAVAILGLQLAAAIGGQLLGGLLAAAVLPPPSFGTPEDPLWRGIPFATTVVLVGLMELQFVRLYMWYAWREKPNGRFWGRAWLLSALVVAPMWLWSLLGRAAPDGLAVTLLMTLIYGMVLYPLMMLALVHAYRLRWSSPEAAVAAA